MTTSNFDAHFPRSDSFVDRHLGTLYRDDYESLPYDDGHAASS
jgi:hypothetical protein